MPAPTQRPVLTSRRPDRYTIYESRGFQLLDTATHGYIHSVHPYGQSHWLLPEQSIALAPHLEGDAAAQALFYCRACQFMRGRITSVQAMIRLDRLVRTEDAAGRPNVLDPKVAIGLSVDYLNEVFSRYSLSRYGAGWQINSQRLLDTYGGNVLRIFDDDMTYEKACFRLCNQDGRGQWGFQNKMTSMLIYYLTEADLIAPFPYPPPVDWHHLSLAIRNEVIDLQGNVLKSKKDLEKGCLADLAALYMRYSQQTGIPSNIIAKACWLQSVYLCSQAPGNGLAARGEYNARSTQHVYEPPDFETDPPAVMEAWLKTCAICPLQKTCRVIMSSAGWYDLGVAGLYMAPRPVPSAERIAESGLFNPHVLVHTIRHKPRPSPSIAPGGVKPLTQPEGAQLLF